MRSRILGLLLALLLSPRPVAAFSGLFEAPYRCVPFPSVDVFAGGSNAFAAGLVDPDAHTDLVLAYPYGCGGIALWSGDGNGDFLLRGIAGAPCAPSAIILTDLDGDGDTEIVVAGRGRLPSRNLPEIQGGVRIFDSDLVPTGVLNTGHYSALAVGSLDGGKWNSIVVGRSVDSLAVVLNPTSPLSFVPTDVPLVAGPTTIGLADMNGDGALDIVALASREVCLVLGHGDGTFGARVFSPLGSNPTGMKIGDFTGDGVLDVLVLGTAGAFTSDVLTVHVGDGQGSFVGRIATQLTGGASASGVDTLDFDHDGRLDVCVFRPSQNLFLAGKGDGSFDPFTGVVMPASGEVPVGDFDGDGVTDRAGKDAGLILRPFLLPGEPVPTRHLLPIPVDDGEVADVDGDEWNDLLVACKVARYGVVDPGVYLLRNDHGVLASPVKLGDDQAWSAQARDLDGDGRLDVAWLGPSRWVGGFGLSVRLAKADGTFGATTIFDTPADPTGLELVDVNGDRLLDAIVSTRSNAVCVLRGDGAGAFVQRVDYAIAGPATGVTVGDWNEDGAPDIAVSMNGDATTPQAILLNDAQGGFAAGPSVAVGGYRIAIDSADLDGDAHLDLAYGGQGPIDITIMRGAGDGTFSRDTTLLVSGVPTRVEARDLDDDGTIDLLCGGTANAYRSPEWWFGGYGPAPRAADSQSPSSRPVLGDLTGDGILDIASNTDLLRGRTPPAGLDVTVGSNGSYMVAPGEQASSIVVISNPSMHERQFVLEWQVQRDWPDAVQRVTLDAPAQGFAFDTLFVTVPDSAAGGLVSIGARAHVRGSPALADSSTAYFMIPVTGLALAPIGSNPRYGSPGVVLSAPAGAPVVVELLSVLGRVIERQTIDDTGGIPAAILFRTSTAGLYFVRARQGKAITSVRTVVLH